MQTVRNFQFYMNIKEHRGRGTPIAKIASMFNVSKTTIMTVLKRGPAKMEIDEFLAGYIRGDEFEPDELARINRHLRDLLGAEKMKELKAERHARRTEARPA